LSACEITPIDASRPGDFSGSGNSWQLPLILPSQLAEKALRFHSVKYGHRIEATSHLHAHPGNTTSNTREIPRSGPGGCLCQLASFLELEHRTLLSPWSHTGRPSSWNTTKCSPFAGSNFQDAEQALTKPSFSAPSWRSHISPAKPASRGAH
jgi:hypothetical protein